MKKLVFLFAMVFAVSIVLGQNTSVKVQSGQDQTAEVEQLGDLNTSYVTQDNKNNSALVEQSNENLQAANANLSTVVQTGKTNIAEVYQTHNGNLTNGHEGLLETRIYQTGDNNFIGQVQGPHGQMGTSLAVADQGGNNNWASQHQLRYGNEAFIYQLGNGNTAKQGQDAPLLDDDDFVGSMNYALIDQSGNNNSASQSQYGWDNHVEAYQSGNGNTSIQDQKNTSWVSEAFVYQSGNNNDALQEQIGSLNSAVIDQASNGNVAEQDQSSDVRRDSGYDPLNRAEIYQLGGAGNDAFQTQTTPGGNLITNFAWAYQNGSDNWVSQTQNGGNNYSTASQTGSGHSATLTQNQVYP